MIILTLIGGLIHRSVEEVEAAMAEYEQDPKGYGLAATGVPQTADFSHLELTGGFQSNDGDMMERPAGISARFKYCTPATGPVAAL